MKIKIVAIIVVLLICGLIEYRGWRSQHLSPVGIVTRMEGIWIKHCDQTIADVCYRKTDGNGHFGGEKAKNTTGSSHCDLYDGHTCYDASDGQNNHIKLTKQQEDAVAKELQ